MKYEADFAVTLSRHEANPLDQIQKYWLWSGWKRRHWPADIIRPGLRLYGFDKDRRELVILLQVTKGGSFTYTSWPNFSSKVMKATGWRPTGGEAHRDRIALGTRDKPCFGYAIRWKPLKRVSIRLSGRFPQLGWLQLTKAAPREAEDVAPPPPGRTNVTVSRVIRDTELSVRLKTLHEHRCQLCGDRLRLSGGSYYSEAHHIKPLGNPHRGVDVAGNVIVLCPNCHVLCDFGALQLSPRRLRKVGGHEVELEYLKYHNTEIVKPAT
jgi:hypothetical protein